MLASMRPQGWSLYTTVFAVVAKHRKKVALTFGQCIVKLLLRSLRASMSMVYSTDTHALIRKPREWQQFCARDNVKHFETPEQQWPGIANPVLVRVSDKYTFNKFHSVLTSLDRASNCREARLFRLWSN